ncbi:MAG: methyltransferase domain-containing protein [Alphaproteobacteria bacterium]
MRRRFLAWWEGLDEADLQEPDEAYLTPAPADMSGPEEGSPLYVPRIPQLADHLTIAQALWGEGYLGPGDRDFILSLVSQLAISRDKSLALLGIGLGGPARDLCRDSGIWVSGYEARPDLIEPASEQCLMAGLARKVSVQHFDPQTTALPDGKYHIVMSRDEFHTLGRQDHMMGQVYSALRPGGSALVTDYVVTEAGDPERLATTAFSDIWGGAVLTTADDLARAMREAGFDLRVRKDMTDAYIDLISATTPGWGRLLDMLQNGDERVCDRREFVQALARETEMWGERLRALKAGELAVYRLFGLKPEG